MPRDDALMLPAGDVVVSAQAVLDIATALELVAAAHQVNGAGRATRLVELRSTFIEAARRVRAFGAETAKLSAPVEVSSSGMADPIGATEAAELMNVSPQNVTGLCRRESLGTARRVGGRWVIERAEVLARIEGKAS